MLVLLSLNGRIAHLLILIFAEKLLDSQTATETLYKSLTSSLNVVDAE